MQLTEDLAALGIEAANKEVVPCHSYGCAVMTVSHRQQRLGSVHSLLSFLVTEHQDTVWRIEIQSDDVTDFVNE